MPKTTKVPSDFFKYVDVRITLVILFGLFYCCLAMAYFPQVLIYKSHLGQFGHLLHDFAVENEEFVRKSFDVVMWVHLTEAFLAGYWCWDLGLNWTTSFKWIISSFVNGFFSLRLVLPIIASFYVTANGGLMCCCIDIADI